MIHRYIYNILKDGVQAITETPDILDELFQDNYELVSEEAEAIETYFLANGLNVYNGYPRKDTKFPSISIILGEENETEHFLNDSAGLITDEDSPNYRAEIFASMWKHSYRLLVITEHPDVTAYYYEIVKFIMLAGQDILADDGCLDFHLSGSELSPDPKYLPEHLFARQLIFSCQREFQRINRNSRLFPIKSVEGIHVDSQGSPSDVGDVKTNVTTYYPE